MEIRNGNAAQGLVAKSGSNWRWKSQEALEDWIGNDSLGDLKRTCKKYDIVSQDVTSGWLHFMRNSNVHKTNDQSKSLVRNFQAYGKNFVYFISMEWLRLKVLIPGHPNAPLSTLPLTTRMGKHPKFNFYLQQIEVPLSSRNQCRKECSWNKDTTQQIQGHINI